MLASWNCWYMQLAFDCPMYCYDVMECTVAIDSVQSAISHQWWRLHWSPLNVETLQLVSSAIQFLASVAERPAYKQLFADTNTLTGICEKVIVPNMEFRGVSSDVIMTSYWHWCAYWSQWIVIFLCVFTLHLCHLAWLRLLTLMIVMILSSYAIQFLYTSTWLPWVCKWQEFTCQFVLVQM